MKFKKLMIFAAAGTLLMSGCSSGGGQTAVKVGDSVITANAVKFTGEELMLSSDASNIAESLQQCYLLYEIAEKSGITLDDEETKSVKQNIASFKSGRGGKTEGEKILKSYGLDDDILSVITSASIYSEKILADMTFDEPTEDELRQYFNDSYLRAKHVLIMTTDSETGEELDDEAAAKAEETANEVLKKAQSGEDFDALIEEYNEDPGMSSSPDGYVFTDNQMVSEFENATKSIQPGEFTMCKTSYGYHVIQRLPLDDDVYFEDNKSSVESAYSKQQEQQAFEDKAAELGITIEVNQEVLDAIKFDDSDADAE